MEINIFFKQVKSMNKRFAKIKRRGVQIPATGLMEDGRSGCWKRPLGRFMLPNNIISLLLVGLLCGLCFLALLLLGSGCLDDTDSNGLYHVTDSETSKRGEVNEGLDAHGLAGDQPNDASVSGLDELRFSSVALPVRLSTFCLISANLQA